MPIYQGLRPPQTRLPGKMGSDEGLLPPRSTDGSTRRSAEKGGRACSPKHRDRIIARHHMKLGRTFRRLHGCWMCMNLLSDFLDKQNPWGVCRGWWLLMVLKSLFLAVVMINMPGYTGLYIIHINWDRIAFSNFNDSMILFFQRWGISISHRIHTWSTCLHLPYKLTLHVGQRYGVLVAPCFFKGFFPGPTVSRNFGN